MTSPEDEDREIELIEYSAEKGTDILIDYGYHILVMPSGKPEDNGLKSKPEPLQIAD